MDDLEREMQSILDVGRQAYDPAPSDAARVRRAIALTLAGTATSAVTGAAAATPALAVGSGTTSAGGAAGLGSASSLFSVAKYGAIGLLVGTTGASVGTAVYSSGHREAGPPPIARAVTTAAEGEPIPTRALRSSPEDEPPPPVEDVAEAATPERRAAAVAALQDPPTTELRAEAQALRRAQQHLESDPKRALRQLDTMQRAHPDGVLTEEALAARVFAHCNLGERELARRVADRFLGSFPHSVHAPRVRASCAMSTSQSNPPATSSLDDGSRVPPTIDE